MRRQTTVLQVAQAHLLSHVVERLLQLLVPLDQSVHLGEVVGRGSLVIVPSVCHDHFIHDSTVPNSQGPGGKG